MSRTTWWRPAAAVALAAMLAACATRPTAPTAPVDLVQARAADSARGDVRDWTLSGRIAVSDGNRGGSGRIDWQQLDGRYSIALSAPVTRQSWRLSGDAFGARLEGLEGGPRESADVEGLLQSATGWNVPVRALLNWVRGIGAAGHEYGPTRLVYGDAGLPARLEQGEWVIEYPDWYPATASHPQLPRRIVARRGAATVRLIVDEWAH